MIFPGKKKFLNFFLKSKLPLSFNSYDWIQRATEGGERMSAIESCQRLLEVLCLRRHDTYCRLACEFGISRETIWNDVEILMCPHLIETVRGRYGGGVQVRADYLPYSRDLSIKYKSAKYVKFRRGEYQSKLCSYGYQKGADG